MLRFYFMKPVMKKVVFLQLGQRLAKVKRRVRAGLQKAPGRAAPNVR
jgi:hypothetical protein